MSVIQGLGLLLVTFIKSALTDDLHYVTWLILCIHEAQSHEDFNLGSSTHLKSFSATHCLHPSHEESVI